MELLFHYHQLTLIIPQYFFFKSAKRNTPSAPPLQKIFLFEIFIILLSKLSEPPIYFGLLKIELINILFHMNFQIYFYNF